ncbi:RxLR-like protein [Plasmopara halstedii]|uniref:RxLR-like protein n=1 Tax=Plasmopara halstedii TaxID=4781 RepID=A0A0P1B2R1_PLAHL|nr:RxLR-like protein [Plasmopara halstedii]CEG49041.1 RxLR-like protein [Plasmopara halstedii]|eukprot:XP_024585410.1 RxLR-like protein [Plasmopara halstedii]
MGTIIRVGGLLLLLSVLMLGYTFRTELQGLRETLQLTYEHRLLGMDYHLPYKNVTVYRNGYSTGGVQIQLRADLLASRNGEGELAAYLSQFVAVEGLYNESISQESKIIDEKEPAMSGIVANRVYNGQGQLIQSYSDISMGDRLYLVAPGLHFVWPFVKLGHRVMVTSNFSLTNEPVIIESISESPRTFRLHNFFTGEEADTLIKRTLEIDDPGNKLQQSTVGPSGSKKVKSKHRTSENAFDTVSDTAIRIRKRVFDVLSLGEYQSDMCDGLQLLRYQQKQANIPHEDYFPLNSSEKFNYDPRTGGSNRFATVFLYLSDVPLGGQTVFPLADMPNDIPVEYQHPANVAHEFEAAGAELFEPDSWEMDMVRKCSTKLASYPSKGGAVLFYSQKPNGELDPMSKHGGCPVLKGTKWGANLWVWNKERYGLTNAENSVKFIVTNPSPREVRLYWNDALMSTLEANSGRAAYNSNVDHKWVIKDGDEIIMEYVIDADGPKTQTITVPFDEEKITASMTTTIAETKEMAKDEISDVVEIKDEL